MFRIAKFTALNCTSLVDSLAALASTRSRRQSMRPWLQPQQARLVILKYHYSFAIRLSWAILGPFWLGVPTNRMMVSIGELHSLASPHTLSRITWEPSSTQTHDAQC